MDLTDTVKENVLTDDLLKQIESIPEVDKIKVSKGNVMTLKLDGNYDEPVLVETIEENEIDHIQDYLIEGTIDIPELTKNNGIVVVDLEIWKQLFGWDVAVGQEINLQMPNEEIISVKIMGILDSKFNTSGGGLFFIPEELLSKHIPSDMNLTYQVAVDTRDDSIDEAEEKIRDLFVARSSVKIETIEDWADNYSENLGRYQLIVYLLVMFIGVFGLINLLNTLLTNVMVRKHEFAMLQAIAVTNDQLRNILLIEGGLYTLSAFLISSTLGTVIGYFVCKILTRLSVFGEVSYRFPYMEMAVYFIFMLIVQVTFSFVIIRQLSKQSLVERIRAL